MRKPHLFWLWILFWVGPWGAPASALAQGPPGSSDGQTIYVPAYSHIYGGDRERPFLLAVTLSVRNTDPYHAIRITAVDYYETGGTLLKNYLSAPQTLKPLESVRYVVPEKDKAGGSGANFLVVWQSDRPVNPPIVEAIMIGTQSQQGLSFTSRGQVIINTR
jgi:hypothetical protein